MSWQERARAKDAQRERPLGERSAAAYPPAPRKGSYTKPSPPSAHSQAQVERTKTLATMLLTSVEADEREAARLLLAKVDTDAEIASLRIAVGEARAAFATNRTLDPLFRANEARLAELRIQSQDLQTQIGIHRRTCQAKKRRDDLSRLQQIVKRNVTPEQWQTILLELETELNEPLDDTHPSP